MLRVLSLRKFWFILLSIMASGSFSPVGPVIIRQVLSDIRLLYGFPAYTRVATILECYSPESLDRKFGARDVDFTGEEILGQLGIELVPCFNGCPLHFDLGPTVTRMDEWDQNYARLSAAVERLHGVHTRRDYEEMVYWLPYHLDSVYDRVAAVLSWEQGPPDGWFDTVIAYQGLSLRRTSGRSSA